MNPRLILYSALILTVSIMGNAQMHSDSVLINFRQSKVNLDTAYMSNSEALSQARRAIDFYHRPDSNFVLKSVKVVGGASPEGSVKFNQWLSHQRAERIYDYIGRQVSMPDSITTFTFLGRDWEGLRRLVLYDANVPYRSEVLATLDQIISSRHDGDYEAGALRRIKALRGGEPYIYMYRHLFPTLRESKLILTFDNLFPRIELPVGPLPDMAMIIEAPAPGRIALAQPRRHRPFYMALKTNMLFDLALLPNISAEFYLGRNISIVGDWMYGWWDTDRKHYYWRAYGGDVALRWWFGRAAHEKPLTGHHVGVFGGIVTYDFELGGRGYMGGLPGRTLWDRYQRVCGVEYGYSLPVGRRINIDFNIGLGYFGGKYIEYIPVDRCYVYQKTRKMNWFGPNKLEVSFTWLIGRGNYNKSK